jgi:hypothetical protein
MASLTAGTGITITGRQEHEIIDAFQLTEAERADFDYLNWPGIDDGTDSGSFFRRNGDLYDLGTFTRTQPGGTLAQLGWHGVAGDSFYSGIAVHVSRDGETMLSALVLSS